jgi:hypothetical protein
MLWLVVAVRERKESGSLSKHWLGVWFGALCGAKQTGKANKQKLGAWC